MQHSDMKGISAVQLTNNTCKHLNMTMNETAGFNTMKVYFRSCCKVLLLHVVGNLY